MHCLVDGLDLARHAFYIGALLGEPPLHVLPGSWNSVRTFSEER